MAITVALIKELRDRTGVGMTKCKAALEEANGDIELAIVNLRKSGMASAVKKEGRSTKEGLIAVSENDSSLALVEINAETDFVVQNDTFKEFAKNIVDEIVNTKPASLEAFLAQKYSKDDALTIDEYRATIVQCIGENIQIKRLMVVDKPANTSTGIYIHMGGKIASVVTLEGATDEQELARDIAMHSAAESPEFLSEDKVTDEVKRREEDIAREQVKNKPANIIDKIIVGKLNAFYDQVCLLRQKFVKNPDITIAELVANKAKESGKDLKVVDFIRWAIKAD